MLTSEHGVPLLQGNTVIDHSLRCWYSYHCSNEKLISQISFNFFKNFSVAYLIYWFIPHNSPDSYSLIRIFLNVTCNVNFTDLVQTLLFYSPLFLHILGSCVELYLQTVRRKNNFYLQFSQSSSGKCHK